MLLQQGRRYLLRYISFHRLLNHRRLDLSPGHQDDTPGLHDRADAHRDGQPRYLRNVLKLVRIGNAGRIIQRHEAGIRQETRSRVVEADMTAYSNELKILTGIFSNESTMLIDQSILMLLCLANWTSSISGAKLMAISLCEKKMKLHTGPIPGDTG